MFFENVLIIDAARFHTLERRVMTNILQVIPHINILYR